MIFCCFVNNSIWIHWLCHLLLKDVYFFDPANALTYFVVGRHTHERVGPANFSAACRHTWTSTMSWRLKSWPARLRWLSNNQFQTSTSWNTSLTCMTSWMSAFLLKGPWKRLPVRTNSMFVESRTPKVLSSPTLCASGGQTPRSQPLCRAKFCSYDIMQGLPWQPEYHNKGLKMNCTQ